MSEAAKQLDGAILSELLSLVKQHTGITMGERKRDLLFARIRRRTRALGINTPEEYVAFLKTSSAEVQEFINSVTTNETFFFRTPIVWEYFQKEFLPEWAGKNSDCMLRVWSAASSSGEEAHSLAIACEEFKARHPSFRYRIYGSDISTEVLGDAKSGIFRGKSMDDFKVKHPELVAKYFKPLPNEVGLKAVEQLTNNIEFSIHNLHRPAPKTLFYDIVFLRNVMIYFSDPDQELVLKNIHGSLKTDGSLVLGESESLARLKTSFVFKKPLIYSKGK